MEANRRSQANIEYLVKAGVVVASMLKERSASSCALSTRRFVITAESTTTSSPNHMSSCGMAESKPPMDSWMVTVA